MNEKEFVALLKEVFNTHMFMSKRDYHSVNELMYVLRSDVRLKEFNFNITIIKADGDCYCIPSIDAFVNIDTLAVWFDDDKIEYEHDYVDDNGFLFYFDSITVYEKEEN